MTCTSNRPTANRRLQLRVAVGERRQLLRYRDRAIYQVRAEFPTNTGSKVSGAYSGQQSSLLILPARAHGRGARQVGSRLLVTWHPEPDARQYEVEVSTTNGFHSRVESHRVDGTSWAPNLDLRTQAATAERCTGAWRPVDERGGVGSFAGRSTVGAPHAASAARAARAKRSTRGLQEALGAPARRSTFGVASLDLRASLLSDAGPPSDVPSAASPKAPPRS